MKLKYVAILIVTLLKQNSGGRLEDFWFLEDEAKVNQRESGHKTLH